MLKISIFEIFFAAMPEVYVLIIGAYLLAGEKLNARRILVIGLLAGISTYLVRLLPIFPGGNILFSLLIDSFLLIAIGKIEVLKAIPSVLLVIIIRLTTEILNVILLIEAFHMDLDVLSGDPVKKTVAFLPSLILFITIILVIYLRKKRKVISKNVSY